MIEHAHTERERERERVIQHLGLCKLFLQCKSLQRKIFHRVSWKMRLFLQEITCQYFQHMGGIKARLKAEASSLNCLLISIPIQHKTLSTSST